MVNKSNYEISYLFFFVVIILEYTNKNRKSPLFNHLSAISEGIPAFGWILVSPTPAPHIKEMSDAAQFYANRVLKEFKEKDPTHVEWVKQWMKVLTDLHAYVKQYHTTGLTWGSLGQQSAGGTSAAASASPPPPPPPPPPTDLLSSSTPIDDGKSRNELMNSINALGEGATSHLKKVSDSQKVHKNPQLREQAAQPISEKSNTSAKSQVCFFSLLIMYLSIKFHSFRRRHQQQQQHRQH